MDALAKAAQKALDTHDRLRVVQELEPRLDDDGMPFDRDAWLAWQSQRAAPAYNLWQHAMAALSRALVQAGRAPLTSRHPFNFRPLCEAILAETKVES